MNLYFKIHFLNPKLFEIKTLGRLFRPTHLLILSRIRMIFLRPVSSDSIIISWCNLRIMTSLQYKVLYLFHKLIFILEKKNINLQGLAHDTTKFCLPRPHLQCSFVGVKLLISLLVLPECCDYKWVFNTTHFYFLLK